MLGDFWGAMLGNFWRAILGDSWGAILGDSWGATLRESWGAMLGDSWGAILGDFLGWGFLGLSWWVYWRGGHGILRISWGPAGGYIGVGYSRILGAQLVGILAWRAWWEEEKEEEAEERIFT